MFYFDEDTSRHGFDSQTYDKVGRKGKSMSVSKNVNIYQVKRKSSFIDKLAENLYCEDEEIQFPNEFYDHYEFCNDGALGRGAYGTVETVISFYDGKEYAVKLIDKITQSHTRSRVINEVKLFCLSRNESNIVQLIDVFEDSDYYFLVFEKMNGGPLLDHITDKNCFTEQEASMVTSKIAKGIKFLHDQGVAHRDIKPENILCSSIDGLECVKLCDLDLATKLTPLKKSPSVDSLCDGDFESPVGSAEFMAPEVVERFMDETLKYDKKADTWSLGVLIYIMLCGYPPFYGQCDSENCGWTRGEICDECQENLFENIKRGYFDFPDDDWKNISDEAKDLICRLLVRNARNRYTIDDVLKHPWITKKSPSIPLITPSNLERIESARDINQINQNFNAIKHINPDLDGTNDNSSQYNIKCNLTINQDIPIQNGFYNTIPKRSHAALDDIFKSKDIIYDKNDSSKNSLLSVICRDNNFILPAIKEPHEVSPAGTVDSGVSDMSLPKRRQRLYSNSVSPTRLKKSEMSIYKDFWGTLPNFKRSETSVESLTIIQSTTNLSHLNLCSQDLFSTMKS
uniref:Protein kinase domain-containing protein n=1 Tax=Parastrongyloides trichosuri TaxID=131310 RepID=A0A0N4Z4X8_PARTI